MAPLHDHGKIWTAFREEQTLMLHERKFLTTVYDEPNDAIYLAVAKTETDREDLYTLRDIHSVVNMSSGVTITFYPYPGKTDKETAFFPYSHVLDRIPDSKKDE